MQQQMMSPLPLSAHYCTMAARGELNGDKKLGPRTRSCRGLMEEEEYGSSSWASADSRLELPEEEIFKVELMYSSRTSQAFVCPCLANLYHYGSGGGGSSSDDWSLFATGVPLLVVDSGPTQAVAKLQIRLAELGTGFTLWRQPVSPFTRYCAVDSGFHTMFTSTVGGCQTVGISFDHHLSAKKFYQQLRLLQSTLSKTETVGDSSATVPRVYLPCAQDAYMSVSSGTRRTAPAPSKSSISGPCCFRHITSLRPSDLLVSYEAMTSSAPGESQGDRNGTSRRAFARGTRSFTNLCDPKDSLFFLNDKDLKAAMQSPLAARNSPSTTAAQTTVVLPPYFFGGASASRQLSQARLPGRQGSIEKPLPSSPWAHSSPALASPKISGQIQRTAQAPRGPPVRSMLEGVGSGLEGLSPVTYDLDSRSLSRRSNLSLTASALECSVNGGYATNGFPTASQLDPFYTQGEDLDPERDLDSACVTVFGFDSETADMILKKFAEFGTICNYEISPSSNWMHILYQSRMQANLALGKNGKIFANRIKIGVEPCVDKEVIKRFRLRSARYQRPVGPEGDLSSSIGAFTEDIHSRSLNRSAFSTNGMDRTTPFALASATPPLSKYENDSKRSMRSMTAPMELEEEEDDTSIRGIASKVWTYLFG
uniref:Nucleoporin NUP35 n=1 Tax=Trichuris muris TaxID=70415 RepID=A0A5S6Q210_TRIMR